MDHARYVRTRDAGTRPRPRTNEWFLSLKRDKPCADCAVVYPPQAMQWDHRPGTAKLGDIGRGLKGMPRHVILEEVAKCDLVCANCHALRTEARRAADANSSAGASSAPRMLQVAQRPRHIDAADVTPMDSEIYRLCSRCQTWKSQTAFHRSRTGQFSYCAECRREYDRRYYVKGGRVARLARQAVHKRNVREWLKQLKADRACADCTRTFAPAVMQWDHLPGAAKLGEISRMAGRARAILIAEIAKCELVCANCHAIRTARRATKHDVEEEAIGYQGHLSTVGVAGLEPANFLDPNQALYQAELHPARRSKCTGAQPSASATIPIAIATAATTRREPPSSSRRRVPMSAPMRIPDSRSGAT